MTRVALCARYSSDQQSASSIGDQLRICRERAFAAMSARLAETLDKPETRPEAAGAIRSIIGRIVLSPGDGRGAMRATLHGELMGILDFVRDKPAAVATVPLVVSPAAPPSPVHLQHNSLIIAI